VPVRLDEDLLENLPTPRSIAGLINPGSRHRVERGVWREPGGQRDPDRRCANDRSALPGSGLHANYNWVQEVNVVALGAPAEVRRLIAAPPPSQPCDPARTASPASANSGHATRWLSSNTKELSATLQRQFDSRS
jgi:hypothetical protein